MYIEVNKEGVQKVLTTNEENLNFLKLAKLAQENGLRAVNIDINPKVIGDNPYKWEEAKIFLENNESFIKLIGRNYYDEVIETTAYSINKMIESMSEVKMTQGTLF